jgi:hypothetical protein
MPIRLYDKERNAQLGTITAAQLEDLSELLEEEGAGDRDRWVNEEIVEYLAEQGADEALVKLLRDAVAGKEGVELEWREEP